MPPPAGLVVVVVVGGAVVGGAVAGGAVAGGAVAGGAVGGGAVAGGAPAPVGATAGVVGFGGVVPFLGAGTDMLDGDEVDGALAAGALAAGALAPGVFDVGAVVVDALGRLVVVTGVFAPEVEHAASARPPASRIPRVRTAGFIQVPLAPCRRSMRRTPSTQ
jgi:hypothetical protein